MDGNMDVESQIRLMRTVIGRKDMEIDDLIEASKNTTPENVEGYTLLIDFLKNDIRGYKAVIDDLKKGTFDNSENYNNIASLPESIVGLYNDYYLPNLKDEDLAEEQTAMSLKNKLASSGVDNKYIRVAKAAFDSPLVLSLMSQNNDLMALIGKVILTEPELVNALNDEQ